MLSPDIHPLCVLSLAPPGQPSSNAKVHTNHLGIVLRCRLWFGSCEMRPEMLS